MERSRENLAKGYSIANAWDWQHPKDFFCDPCREEHCRRQRTLYHKVIRDASTKHITDSVDYISFSGMNETTLPKMPPVPSQFGIGVILGPSGSGKTQLLRSRFGMEADGHNWGSKPPPGHHLRDLRRPGGGQASSERGGDGQHERYAEILHEPEQRPAGASTDCQGPPGSTLPPSPVHSRAAIHARVGILSS